MEDEQGSGVQSDSGKLSDEKVVESNRVEGVSEEGDGEEIMVEVVGSDVFVDGVGGDVEGDSEMAEAVGRKEESRDVMREGDGKKMDEVDTSLSMSIGPSEKVSELSVGPTVDDEGCNRGVEANVASEEKESKGVVVDEDVSELVTRKSGEKVDLGEGKEVLPSNDDSTSHDRVPEEMRDGNDGGVREVDSVNASGGEIPESATQKDDSFRAEVESSSTDCDSGKQGKSVLENNVSAAESKGSIPEPNAPTDVSNLQEKYVSAAKSKDSISEIDAPTDVSDLQEKDGSAAENKDSIPEPDAPTDVSNLQDKDVSAAENKDSISEIDAPTDVLNLHEKDVIAAESKDSIPETYAPTDVLNLQEKDVSTAESKDSVSEIDAPTDVLDLQEKDVSAAESKDSIPEHDAPTDVSDLQEKDVSAAKSKESSPELDAPTDVSNLQEKDVGTAESKDSISEIDAPTDVPDLQGKDVISAESKDSIPEPDAPTDSLDLQGKNVSAAESKESITEPVAPIDASDLQEKDVSAAESKGSISEVDTPTDVSDLQRKDVSAAESKDTIPKPNGPIRSDDLDGAKLEPNDQTDGVPHDVPKSVQENSFDASKEETVGNDECSKAEGGAEADQLNDGGVAVEADKDENLAVEIKDDMEENVQNKASVSGSTHEEIVQSDSGIAAETSDQNAVITSVKDVEGNESGEKGMEIDDSVDNVPSSEAVANIIGECGLPESTKEVAASQETEPSIHELEKTEMMSNKVSIKPEGNGSTEPLPSSTDVSSLDGGVNEENRANGFHAVEAQEIHTSEGNPTEVKEEENSDRICHHAEQDVDAETATEGPSSESENSKMSNEESVKYAFSLRMKQSSYLPPPKDDGFFAPSDLVWGKVRSHPWWPGQIFEPKDASEKAVKHHKKDSFLVAYFGDQTFAWNDASALKPFRPYFSQIEKQSNSESFHNAVDCALEEVERRVQLGLSCSCTPKDEYSKIETQVIENTGIREESSRRNGVDQSSCASCFEPNELLEFITNAAPCASFGADRLDIVIARAQLSAFCSFKGYGSPIEFPSSGELLENDEDTIHVRKEGDQSRKERSLVELMGDGEYSLDEEDESADHGKSPTGKKRKAIDPLEGSDKRASVSAANPKPSFKIGECIRRVANQLTGTTTAPVDGSPSVYEPSEKQSVVESAESLSVTDMLSQLELLALDPKKRHTGQNQIRAFFMGFRSSIALSRRGRKKKSEQAVGGSGEDFEFDDVNDSYWTDRIVQNHEDESLQVVPFNVEKTVKSDRKPHSRKRFSTGNSPTQASEFDENAKRIKQESSPAELILSFAERNRIPSEISLNKMFRRFGPLMESETEVDHESSSAKVIFKRGSDAEVARNSAEKFSIFGPVVVSYQIGYSPVISVKILPVSLPSQEEAPLMI